MDAHTLIPATNLAGKAKPLFPGESDPYRKAREALLVEEIELRRHITRVAEQRQALPPGPVIAKNYRFKDANGAEIGLIDLFGTHDALVHVFLDVRTAARTAMPDVHQFAWRGEW